MRIQMSHQMRIQMSHQMRIQMRHQMRSWMILQLNDDEMDQETAKKIYTMVKLEFSQLQVNIQLQLRL